MKLIISLISSICMFSVICINLYYSIVMLDFKKMEGIVIDSNIMLNEIIEEEELIFDKEEYYIEKIESVKEELIHNKTTPITNTYKIYKVNLLDNLAKYISSKGDITYKDNIIKYEKLGQRELQNLID